MFGKKTSLAEVELTFHAVADSRYRPYEGALVSFAHTRTDGQPKLVSCRWAFVDQREQVRATVTYPALVLEERWFPITEAFSALLRVLRGESVLGECALRNPVQELQELDTSRETLTGWRETVFEATLTNSYLYDRIPVVAKGLRPYTSIAGAVADWVWQKGHDSAAASYHVDVEKLRVLLPDTRARIRKARWIGNTLTISNERNAAPEDVELQGLIVDGRSATMLPSRAVEPEVAWDVPEEADRIEVYLVHRDGTLLSQRQLRRGEHYNARPGDFAVRERAEEELRQGEGERVEYKPFIAADNRKETELLRTVVAFSNSFGGRVYVGVEDDGTPQSDVQLRKIGRADEVQSLTLMIKRIERLIREKIKPVPDARVSPISVFGRSIIVINILAGEDAPYSTFENDVFIRKGATSRKCDPITELPSIVARAGERRERRERQERDDAMSASSYQKGDD